MTGSLRELLKIEIQFIAAPTPDQIILSLWFRDAHRMNIYREAIIEAAARRGLNFMLGTPNSVAYYLMRYDDAFRAADYTSLVALVREWQSAGKAVSARSPAPSGKML